MARSIVRLLGGALLLLQAACGRAGGSETKGASPYQSPSVPSSSAAGKLPSAPHSAALHPALGGHPPSYWQEQGQRPVTDEASIPEEAWGRRFRYRTSVRGTIGTPCLCQGRGFACEEGPVVRGLTWARIPWARKVNGELEASVELVGVLSRDALTLTEPPRRPPRIDEAETLTSLPLPCEKPAEGWRVRDPGLVGSEHEQAAGTYAEKQSEHSATWFSWHPSITRAERARFSPDKGVFVFTFTENLELHRQRLLALWGGALCVAAGELTQEVRNGIISRAAYLLRREGRRHGLLCTSFGMSGGSPGDLNRVTVHGAAWDKAKLSLWLSHELAGFPVEVISPLEIEPEP
jgi:hypothetical protein